MEHNSLRYMLLIDNGVHEKMKNQNKKYDENEKDEKMYQFIGNCLYALFFN